MCLPTAAGSRAPCRRATGSPRFSDLVTRTMKTNPCICTSPIARSASIAASRNSVIRARTSVRPLSTKSSTTAPAAGACRSTPPTACIAKPAMSKILTASSPGRRPKVDRVRTIRTCERSPQFTLRILARHAFGLQIVGACRGDLDLGELPDLELAAPAHAHDAIDLGGFAGAARDRHAVLDSVDQHANAPSDARTYAGGADGAGFFHETLVALCFDWLRHRLGDGIRRGTF